MINFRRLIRPAGLTQEGEKEEEESNSSDTKKYPLAVIYHGGPQGSTGDDWHYRWNLQYYASMGFAVLAPNFHGSTGFGHQFCRDISGNWEIGGIDTIAGVKAVLEKHSSWIDPDRVVGLGASYGGSSSGTPYMIVLPHGMGDDLRFDALRISGGI